MAEVVFRSRDSVTYFSRLLRRSPELRQRIKVAVIMVQDAADQSWVSCVPFLLPLQLDSLRLDSDVDISVLHPTASRRFDLPKVKEIDLTLVRYTRYSQIARFAVSGAVKATWVLQKDVLSNGGVIRGKRTALKNVVVSAHNPRELIALLRNFSIFSSNPLAIDFNIDPFPTVAAHSNPLSSSSSSSLRKPPVFLRQYSMYFIPENRLTLALKHLPGDHQAIWNCLLRIWQMHCCRNREEAVLERLSICDMTTRFTLSRQFLRESSDVGPSTLVLQVWEMLDGIPAYAGAVLGFLSQLGFQEVKLKLKSTQPWFKPDLVLFLDDALSLPNFSTLTRVTLQVSLKVPPSACKRNFAPLMLPRTYARGLMELVDDCKRSDCVIHRPPPSVSPLPAPGDPPPLLDLW